MLIIIQLVAFEQKKELAIPNRDIDITDIYRPLYFELKLKIWQHTKQYIACVQRTIRSPDKMLGLFEEIMKKVQE